MNIIDWTGNAVLNPSWPSNKRSVGSITKIVVHHDAVDRPKVYDDKPRYESEARSHNQRIGEGQNIGLQYHYKINNVGDVYKIRPHEVYLWHCGNLPANKVSIAICIDGNFENQTPTKEQYKALKELLDNLCTQHPEFPADQNDVFGHREISATACPGKNMIGFVIDYRNNKGNVGIPDVAYNDGHKDGTPAPAPTPAPQPTPQPPVDPCAAQNARIADLEAQLKSKTDEYNRLSSERDEGFKNREITINNLTEQLKVAEGNYETCKNQPPQVIEKPIEKQVEVVINQLDKASNADLINQLIKNFAQFLRARKGKK